MLLFNLLEHPEETRTKTHGYWIGAALLLVGLTLAAWPKHDLLRPIAVEEKEVVISTFERLGQVFPAQSEWAEDFSDAVASGSVRIFITKGSPTLFKEENEIFIFDESFFTADSVTQRQWLATVLLPAAQIAIGKSE